jgi:BirA family transcriptional regulator, biotin operon repressor / biotin---[acetyl-CoA-carboxylase] ligase
MVTPRLSSFYNLVTHERIDSTNEEAKRLAATGAPAGTLIWAGEQLAGRGRRGRGWTSPPGNLYLSLLLRPGCVPSIACQLNFVAAVALAEAAVVLLPSGVPVALKWPNDVLINGAKVSGILLEAAAAADHMIDWLVIGVGVNIASHPADTPYPATSLQREGVASTPAEVLEAFASSFERWHDVWREVGFTRVRDRWLASARGLGEPIEIRLERETLHGRFSDLDETGALMLDMGKGGSRQVTTGDLFFPQL